MNKLHYAAIGAFLFTSLTAQIQNSGFEDSSNGTMNHWNIKKADSFDIQSDNTQAYKGKFSIKLSGKSTDDSPFQSFSQVVSLHAKEIQKIEISAYVKSEATNGSINLWAQVMDSKGEMIDFGNSDVQEQSITVNKDWTKYSLTFIIDKNTKSIKLGGVLLGAGTAWFDDFSIQKINFSNEEASKTSVKYIEDIKSIIKKNSIVTDKIDWNVIDSDLSKISKGMKTIKDTDPAVRYLMLTLQEAGDRHSFISSKEHSDKQNSTRPPAIEPESQLIDHSIGYISIPGFNSLNTKVGGEFTSKIQDMIKKLDSENNIKGWIVDLRNNTGGNMYPMITGLRYLIGEGTLGYFVQKDKKQAWTYIAQKDKYRIKNPQSKIAVLIGPDTASSGEATAIAFIGKNNVQLIGQPSAGFTSANEPFSLSDGKNLALATSYEMDKNGKIYTGKITPDIIVEQVPDKDMDLETAKKWITE